jgi:hypothetical protein
MEKDLEILDFYKNKKNEQLYKITDFVINCTNEQDGQHMVEYIKVSNNNNETQVLVREIKEFCEKFEFYED